MEDLIFAQDVFEENLNYQHYASCLIYISIIYLDLEQFEQAKHFIMQAISQARESKQHEQVKMATGILNDILLKI